GQVLVMFRSEIAGDFESNPMFRSSFPQDSVRLTKHVQAFFGSDSREIPNDELIRIYTGAPLVAFEAYSQRHNVHAGFRYVQLLAHRGGIEVADRDEPVHKLDVFANKPQGFASVRFTEPVNKQILTLKRAQHRQIQLSFNWSRKRNQKRVRQVHNVGWRLALHPLDKAVQLLALVSVFALQHRDGHFGERPWVHGDRALRNHSQSRLGIPKAIKKLGSVPEQGHVLFKEYADAAEKDSVRADVWLVGERRRVNWHKLDVVTLPDQLRGERIVPQTTPAVHPRRSRCDRKNLHRCCVFPRGDPNDPCPMRAQCVTGASASWFNTRPQRPMI